MKVTLMMQPYNTSLQILTGCVASVVALGLAVGAPLLTLGKVYDLHLFPRNDDIGYAESRTHIVSQVTHCLALGFFAVALLVSVGAVSVFANVSRPLQNRITTSIAFLTTFATISHLIAIVTLIKIATDWKKKLNRLPIPPPNIDVDLRAGLYADFIGYIFAFSTCVLAVVTAVRLTRRGYVQLE
jgi:hypothetical protein